MDQTSPMTKDAQTQNIPERPNPPEKPTPPEKQGPLKWWVGTVILTLFPSLAKALLALSRNIKITLEMLIGDGEIVLASFVIIASTLINYHNFQRKTSKKADRLYFELLFGSFTELVVYTGFQTTPDEEKNIIVIGLASLFALIASIFVSWSWGKIMEGDGLS